MTASPFPLDIFAGRIAYQRLQEQGWTADLFDLLLGASGGPKWLVLSQLDIALHDTLLSRRSSPLTAVGSSIGCWRHAYLAQSDPQAAMEAFLDPYLHQTYEGRPTTREISAVTRSMLSDLLGREGKQAILDETRLRTRIVTARAPVSVNPKRPLRMASHMASAAVGNAVSRSVLQRHFQRVIFHSGSTPHEPLPISGFSTEFVPLEESSIAPAIHASSSIPAVLTGESNIHGAPPGHYWDGGIIDYHFDLAHFCGPGLILYPHFATDLTPGWFDKMWRRRKHDPRGIDHLVLLAPNRHFVSKLPHAKIPDRSDFKHFDPAMRQRYWSTVVERSTHLAEAWHRVVADPNPVRFVERRT